VYFSELGIDIINMNIQPVVKAIEKPPFRSPMDRPVYSWSRGKEVPVCYRQTRRYAERKRVLSGTTDDEIKKVKDTFRDWELKEKSLWKLGMLRYKKKVVYFPPGT
jgi:hypothetical protein